MGGPFYSLVPGFESHVVIQKHQLLKQNLELSWSRLMYMDSNMLLGHAGRE